ncbi:peptidyl-tRNA hydrolase 2, mitochondrial-like [Quercus lobata]|uniref:peptidyl-tRNA hydrolase 2, mitochondrial-like n=1 Tax=Quercus lobata TaxID=97700 RepID=UPI0012472C92|nr:peptidyl-tRNA hydrolase 2, mitochondrial-like [Quercus lobata]
MVSINPENFIPGLVIGFILLGFCWIYLSPQKNKTNKKNFVPGKPQFAVSNNSDQELKMVLIVRQDLKMKSGKIASQCAHAATGMYVDLMQSQHYDCMGNT